MSRGEPYPRLADKPSQNRWTSGFCWSNYWRDFDLDQINGFATRFNKQSGTSPGFPISTIPHNDPANSRQLVTEPNAFRGRNTTSSNRKSMWEFPHLAVDGVQPQLYRSSCRGIPWNYNIERKFFAAKEDNTFYLIILAILLTVAFTLK
jgi:hypothetical protein